MVYAGLFSSCNSLKNDVTIAGTGISLSGSSRIAGTAGKADGCNRQQGEKHKKISSHTLHLAIFILNVFILILWANSPCGDKLFNVVMHFTEDPLPDFIVLYDRHVRPGRS